MTLLDYFQAPHFAESIQEFDSWMRMTFGDDKATALPLFVQVMLFEAWCNQDAKAIARIIIEALS